MQTTEDYILELVVSNLCHKVDFLGNERDGYILAFL